MMLAMEGAVALSHHIPFKWTVRRIRTVSTFDIVPSLSTDACVFGDTSHLQLPMHANASRFFLVRVASPSHGVSW